MNKVIITGVTGFVGNAVAKNLVSNGVKVLGIGSREYYFGIDSDLFTYVQCKMENIYNLVEKYKDDGYSTLYHFAWAGTSGSDRANTKLQLQNVQWTIDIINVAKMLGCSRVIGAGSIMEHETLLATYTNGNKPGLGYIYGGAKLISHTMSMSIAANLGIDLVWAEITNAYGVGEISQRMINTAIRTIIKGESPQFTSGTQNYDFVYIDDVARACYLIGKNGKPFNRYVIGSGKAKPLKEFLLEMKHSIAPNIDFVFGSVPFTGIDLPLHYFDCKKTEEDTGFRAEVSFGDGTKRIFDWLKATEG